MPDDRQDGHLAPASEEAPEHVTTAPPGLRSLVRFGRDMGRFVRLCERQGTRLVDLVERWVVAAESANETADRHTRAMERLADSIGGPEDD